MENSKPAGTKQDESLPESTLDVPDLVRQRFDSLSPQLRKAAHYLLANPEEVAMTSMRRIAAHAGVKASTMVRLARALGFEGFEEMREPYRQWMRGDESPVVVRARSLQQRGEQDTISELLNDMAKTDADNLLQALGNITDLRQKPGTYAKNTDTSAKHICDDEIPPEDNPVLNGQFRQDGRQALEHASHCLHQARRVFVLGLRSCYALAHFFHYGYSQAHGNAQLLHGAGGTLFDQLRSLNAQDVLLVMSFRPYTREAVMAAIHAAESGTKVIAITDSPISPLAEYAEVLLCVDTTSPSYFQSLVPALSIVQMLLAMVVAHGGEETLVALKENHDQLSRFDAYWPEKRRRRQK